MAEVKGVLEKKPTPSRENLENPVSADVSLRRHALLAGFAGEKELLGAVAAVREHGWPIIDVYAPYAVHGLDRALGLRRSRLSAACFLCGLFGVALALFFQFWSTAWSWPLNVGGQPWNSLPAFIPVTFELMVLCGGLGMVLAWLMRSGFYPGKEATLPVLGETDNRFILVLGLGLRVDPVKVAGLLRDQGAVLVREVE
jgi:hypothetical protein